MNIGIYGHSLCSWYRQQDFNFISKLKSHYNATIQHHAVAQGSEERILFKLKKTKDLDLAIIFHARPESIFVPSWDRDCCSMDRENLKHKIKDLTLDDFNRDVDTKFTQEQLNFFKKIPNLASYEVLLAQNINDESQLENLVNEWNNGNTQLIKKWLDSYNNKEFYHDLFNALELNKKYLFHHDLQRSRYYGSLMQIDQYLLYKEIPVVHCIGNSSWYPNWFEFKSGIIENSIYKFNQYNEYKVTSEESDNSINTSGNSEIFRLLIPLIDQAFEKVNKEVLAAGEEIPEPERGG